MELLVAAAVDIENPIIGDLMLRNGDLVWSTNLAEETAQRIRIRFQFFKGEWFLDLRQGTPWFEDVLIKNPNMRRVRAICNQLLITTPGVAAVTKLEASLNHSSRELSVAFSCRLKDGSELKSTDFAPFIVGV